MHTFLHLTIYLRHFPLKFLPFKYYPTPFILKKKYISTSSCSYLVITKYPQNVKDNMLSFLFVHSKYFCEISYFTV